MKLEKAIAILDTHQCDMPRKQVPDLIAAIKLGVEAFKRLQEIRQRDPLEAVTLLPGETKEIERCR